MQLSLLMLLALLTVLRVWCLWYFAVLRKVCQGHSTASLLYCAAGGLETTQKEAPLFCLSARSPRQLAKQAARRAGAAKRNVLEGAKQPK